MRTSKLPEAAERRTPFLNEAQPISGTVRTSCSGSSKRNLRGTHSSSRIRMGEHRLLGQLQDREGKFAAHRREVLQEMIERIPFFEVVKEGLHGHSRAGKDHGAAHHLVRTCNQEL